MRGDFGDKADAMSIEIEIVNGDQSAAQVKTLFAQSSTAEEGDDAPWRRVKWADPDLRVLIDAPDGELACHTGIFFRTATWNGQKVHIGGIGQLRQGNHQSRTQCHGTELPSCQLARASREIFQIVLFAHYLSL